jgi:hypothetical protein
MAATIINSYEIDLLNTDSKYLTPIGVWLRTKGHSPIVSYVNLVWVLVDWFKGLKDGAVVIRTIAELIDYDKFICRYI